MQSGMNFDHQSTKYPFFQSRHKVPAGHFFPASSSALPNCFVPKSGFGLELANQRKRDAARFTERMWPSSSAALEAGRLRSLGLCQSICGDVAHIVSQGIYCLRSHEQILHAQTFVADVKSISFASLATC